MKMTRKSRDEYGEVAKKTLISGLIYSVIFMFTMTVGIAMAMDQITEYVLISIPKRIHSSSGAIAAGIKKLPPEDMARFKSNIRAIVEVLDANKD